MDEALAALAAWDASNMECIETLVGAFEAMAADLRAHPSTINAFGHRLGRWVRLTGLGSAALGDLVQQSMTTADEGRSTELVDQLGSRLQIALGAVLSYARTELFKPRGKS